MRMENRRRSSGTCSSHLLSSILNRSLSVFDPGLHTLHRGFPWLPSIVHPEPIGWVTLNRAFKRAVYVQHDICGRPPFLTAHGGDLIADFDAPAAQGGAITDGGMQGELITLGKERRGRSGRTVSPEKRHPDSTATGMLVGQKAQN